MPRRIAWAGQVTADAGPRDGRMAGRQRLYDRIRLGVALRPFRRQEDHGRQAYRSPRRRARSMGRLSPGRALGLEEDEQGGTGVDRGAGGGTLRKCPRLNDLSDRTGGMGQDRKGNAYDEPSSMSFRIWRGVGLDEPFVCFGCSRSAVAFSTYGTCECLRTHTGMEAGSYQRYAVRRRCGFSIGAIPRLAAAGVDRHVDTRADPRGNGLQRGSRRIRCRGSPESCSVVFDLSALASRQVGVSSLPQIGIYVSCE